MNSNYKLILEKYTGHTKATPALAKALNYYANGFINKNSDHINFFGSNLSGVYDVYFTTMDKNVLMVDIFGDLPDAQIRKDIRALPYVGSNWVVATEPVTVVCMYYCHLFLNSSLPEKIRQQAMIDCAMIVHFKFITSLMNHYFTYNVNMATALATYSALSGKFTIKQEGTWYKTLKRRVNDLLFDQDTWREQIKNFDNDEEIIKMLSDMQVRMRSMVKNIAEVTYRLHAKGIGVDAGSDTFKTDEGLKVKEVMRLQGSYHEYLVTIITEPRSFIKTELVELIGAAITTMPTPPLYDVLMHMSKLAAVRDPKTLSLCQETILYLFEYLQREGKDDGALNDKSLLLEKIKALITASKTRDPAVLKMRKLSEHMVKYGCKTSSPAAVSGLRTGVILYLILRCVTKEHFH